MTNSIATIVYMLCALTSAVCAALLVRGYRRSGARLLFWSALCFIGLALNNVLLLVDVHVVPQIDLLTVRLLPALGGLVLLLYGLIWETR
jgi:hypothetical protein